MEKPRALVFKPGTRGRGIRLGKGFSLGEIKRAGIDEDMARRLNIYVDRRRKSVHEENVNILKEYLKKLKKKSS